MSASEVHPSAAGKGNATPEQPLIVGNYRLDKTLGQGTYGKVKLAYRVDTNEKVG